MSTGLTTTTPAATLSKILEGMTPEVRMAREAIAGILKAGEAGMLLQAWDLGNWVKTLKANPDQYGESSVEQISRSLQLDGFPHLKATRLYDSMGLVECWPERSEIEAFAEEGKLTVQHLTEVKRLQSGKDRKKMLKLACDKNLSANQVRAEILGTGAKTNRPGTKRDGRPLKKPASLVAGLKLMLAFLVKGRNLDRLIWNGYVLKRLSTMSDSSVNEKLLLDLEEVIAAMDDYSNQTRVTLDLLRKELQKKRKVLSGKGTEEPLEAGKGNKKTPKKAGAAAA